MTDRIDHRASAEGELLNALGYVYDADLSKADRAYQSINFALIHALLAIHDTLTEQAAADRYAANEARQREDAPEPDPLDEDDHRDRLDCEGDLWGRNLGGCWHTRILRSCGNPDCKSTLAHLNERYGPLTFAPDAAQETPSTTTKRRQGSDATRRVDASRVRQAGGGRA